MSIASVKIDLAKRLLESEDVNLINYLKAVFDTRDDNWWENLPAEVRKDIELGIKQADNNETISHKEARKMYQKWLTK